MKWNIGCSGFYYKEWKNLFYPAELPQKKWFEFYCSKFGTLEMNVTFYQFPRKETLRKWFDASPQNFRFSVKAPRLITHYKRLNDSAQLLDNFYKTIQEGLQDKLGAALFQFPPSFIYNPDNLESILDNLNRRGFINVTEFRHKSWWNPEVYAELEKANIIFSGISHPKLPDETIVNQSIAYYRFHGVPDLYNSEYDHKSLEKIIKIFLSSQKCKEVFIYFNNTASMAAIENSIWLKKYLEID